MTDDKIAPEAATVAIKDWIARRFVAFAEDLAILFLHFGFTPAQAQLVARLVVGEIVELGAKERRLIEAAEAAKREAPPPAMPSGAPIALVIGGLQISAWIRDRAGGVETRLRLGEIKAAQTTHLGAALGLIETPASDRPVFALDGTTAALSSFDMGVVLDAPAMDDALRGLEPMVFRSLILLRHHRFTANLAREGVVQVTLDAAVPVDRRLVGVTAPVREPEASPRPNSPRIDQRV